jgi:hypothetical protein
VPRASILYVTDLTYDRFDPADLFDLAFVLRSPRHELCPICLTETAGDGGRILDRLISLTDHSVPYVKGVDGLKQAISGANVPVNLVVTGGYGTVIDLIASDKALIRQKVARIFVVGGLANDYEPNRTGERLPIDPRLKERNPERFRSLPYHRPANSHDPLSLAHLLTSGEGIIWLPRDICLWRYAAPQILPDGGPLCEFLLRELFFDNLMGEEGLPDRYDAAESPVLLSSLPGLLLATEPDPFVWMRLFRAIPAYVEITEEGNIRSIDTQTEAPNLYVVIAIDGQALGKVLTQTLRQRPLGPTP